MWEVRLEASSTTSAAPTWSTAALVVAFLVLAGTVVALFLVKDDAIERRVYWSGFTLAAAVVAIAVGHRGFGTAVATFVAIVLMSAVYAFLRTDYLKIGRRVYRLGRS